MKIEEKKIKWLVLFITTANMSLIFLNSTSIPLALPTLEKTFSFSSVSVIWIVNIYLLALIAFLLISGRLSEIVGKKTLFILGFSVFGLGSLLGGFSFDKWSLIISRIIQGIGGGLSLPSSASLVMSHFPHNERGKAVGINTAIGSVFMIIGAPLGGFLTTYLGWRYIFWLNVPLAFIGVILTCLILKKEKLEHKEKFHGMEAFLLIGTVISLVVGLMEGTNWGWASYKTLSIFALFVVLLISFILYSEKGTHSIIPFSLFKEFSFRGGLISVSLTQLLVMVTVLWSIYFQEEREYTASQTGMILLFVSLPVMIFAPFGGFISDRISPKIPMIYGFGMIILSFIWLIVFVQAKKIGLLLPGLFAFGMGTSSVFAPGFTQAMSKVGERKLGSASSLVMISRQLASTIGIAVMTALYHSFHTRTGSATFAFIMVLTFCLVMAIIGLFTVIILIKKEPIPKP